MFAYIPARGGSKRVPHKNVRPLGGKPLIVHVLEALAQVPSLSGIGVSSDDAEILRIANGCPGVETLAPRDRSLADDHVGFMDLVHKDVPRYAERFKDQQVLFVTPTAALVPSSAYTSALERFARHPGGLVLGVVGYSQSPYLALTGQPEEGLQVLFPEMYSKRTQDLPLTYMDAGCFYAFSLNAIQNRQRFLDLQPIQGVELPADVGIDLDTEENWRQLEASYQNHAIANR